MDYVLLNPAGSPTCGQVDAAKEQSTNQSQSKQELD